MEVLIIPIAFIFLAVFIRVLFKADFPKKKQGSNDIMDLTNQMNQQNSDSINQQSNIMNQMQNDMTPSIEFQNQINTDFTNHQNSNHHN